MERAIHDNGSAPAGAVLSLENRACGALLESETSRPITARLVRTTEHGRTRGSTDGNSMRGEPERHQREE